MAILVTHACRIAFGLTVGDIISSVFEHSRARFRYVEKEPPSSAEWHEVRDMVQYLKERLNINENITIVERKNYEGDAAVNVESFFSGKSLLYISSDFMKRSKGEKEFILAHELSHIKHGDVRRTRFYSVTSTAVVSVCAAVALSLLFPTTLVIGAVTLAALITRNVACSFFEQRVELRADKEGFSVCSELGRRGAITFFEKCAAEKEKISVMKNVIFYAALLLRSGIYHPPESTRIQALHSQRHVQEAGQLQRASAY
jgi:Zn-dependent protease with chaperone function